MQTLYAELSELFPLDTLEKHRAASVAVCKRVIAANPIPSPDQIDAETLAWRLEP